MTTSNVMDTLRSLPAYAPSRFDSRGNRVLVPQAETPTGRRTTAVPTTLGLEDWHHICAMPLCHVYSPEELRLTFHNPFTRTISRPTHGYGSEHRGGTLMRAYLPSNPWKSFAPRPAPVCCSYGGNVLFFDVGKGKAQQRFAIHDLLVVERSEFVRLALRREWKEAKERIVTMAEDEPAAFELYQIWLYHKRLPCPGPFRTLVHAFLLGDKLVDGAFQDAIVDYILEELYQTGLFDVSLTNLIYNNTMDTSPLRRLFRDIYAWAGSAEWLDETKLEEDVNGEFAVDLSKAQMGFLRSQRPNAPPWAGNLCVYHGHESGYCYRSWGS